MSDRLKVARAKKGTWGIRLGLYLLTIVLAIFSFWLLGFVLDDIRSIRPPDYEYKSLSESYGKKTNIQKELDALNEKLNNRRESMDLQSSASAGLQKTIEELKDDPSRKEELNEKMNEFIEAQKKYQEINHELKMLVESRDRLESELREINSIIAAKEYSTAEEKQKLNHSFKLKLAFWEFLVLIPLTIIVAFLLYRKKNSSFFQIYLAFFISVVLHLCLASHRYFPSQYFKYLALGACIIIILGLMYYLIKLITKPKPNYLQFQYRQAYERFLCPICEYPIRIGALRYLYWNRRSAERCLSSVRSQCAVEPLTEPYICPSCGTELYHKCPHCEKDNVEDAVYCAYCGKSLAEEPVPEVVSEPEPVEEPVVEETPVVDEVEVAPIAVEEAEVKEEQPIEIEEVSTNVEEEKKEEEKKPLVPFTKLSRLSVILMLVATMILGVLPILVVNVNSLGGFDNAFMTYIDALINFNTQVMFTYYSMAVWFLLPMVVCVIYAIVAFGMLIFNIVKGFDKYRNYSKLFAPTVAFAFYFMMIAAASASSWNFFFSASLWPNMIIAILIILATILGIVANVLRKVERKNANLLSTQAIIKTVFGYVGAAIVLAGLFLMFTDVYFAATVAYFMRQDVTSTPPDMVPFIFGAVNSIIVPIFMVVATQTLIGLSTDGVRYRNAIAGASFALASYVIILVGAIVTNSISGLAIVTYVFLALSVILVVATSILGYFKRKEDKALLQEYVN